MYGVKTWTLRKLDQKYLESFETWCCRRMEISWTDRVRNEEVLQRVKEEKNFLQTMKRRKVDWIGHILCRNCRLKYVIERKIEGMIEVKGRRGGRKREQLLDALKEMRDYGNWKKIHLIALWLWKNLWKCRRTNSTTKERTNE